MQSIRMFRKLVSFFFVLIVGYVLSEKDTIQQAPFQCGTSRLIAQRLIRHGHDTAPGEWPWHAAIYHRTNRADSYACGGTLISEPFVLTAAHCVLDPGNEQQLVKNRIFVRLGVHNLDELASISFQQHKVHMIHRHPNHEGVRNDIAILELGTMARFNDYVQPACLSISSDLTGKFGTVVGWGLTESDEISRKLKTTRMPVVDAITCLKSDRVLFGRTLDEGLFCAGFTNGTGVCNGDSGGGIFFKETNAWHLGGIVSFSRQRDDNRNLCHSKSYSAFTKVFTYLDWITSVTGLNFSITEEPVSDLGYCEAEYVDPAKTYANHLLPEDCGVYITDRITRGNRTKVFEFPWMAIVQDGKQFCEGTLINKRYVLTSVGCTLGNDKESFIIILGEHTRHQDKDCNIVGGHSECAPPIRRYGIECFIRHQSYDPEKYLNDIALIRMDRDVQFEIHIQPICLSVTNALKKFHPERYIMTGWGRTSANGTSSKELLKGIVTSADQSKCQKWTNSVGGVLDDRQLCVGQPGEPSFCGGDHGGPLGYSAWYNGMRFIQFGIASYGAASCDCFSTYTNVASYMDWIIANMKP